MGLEIVTPGGSGFDFVQATQPPNQSVNGKTWLNTADVTDLAELGGMIFTWSNEADSGSGMWLSTNVVRSNFSGPNSAPAQGSTTPMRWSGNSRHTTSNTHIFGETVATHNWRVYYRHFIAQMTIANDSGTGDFTWFMMQSGSNAFTLDVPVDERSAIGSPDLNVGPAANIWAKVEIDGVAEANNAAGGIGSSLRLFAHFICHYAYEAL